MCGWRGVRCGIVGISWILIEFMLLRICMMSMTVRVLRGLTWIRLWWRIWVICVRWIIILLYTAVSVREHMMCYWGLAVMSSGLSRNGCISTALFGSWTCRCITKFCALIWCFERMVFAWNMIYKVYFRWWRGGAVVVVVIVALFMMGVGVCSWLVIIIGLMLWMDSVCGIRRMGLGITSIWRRWRIWNGGGPSPYDGFQ